MGVGARQVKARPQVHRAVPVDTKLEVEDLLDHVPSVCPRGECCGEALAHRVADPHVCVRRDPGRTAVAHEVLAHRGVEDLRRRSMEAVLADAGRRVRDVGWIVRVGIRGAPARSVRSSEGVADLLGERGSRAHEGCGKPAAPAAADIARRHARWQQRDVDVVRIAARPDVRDQVEQRSPAGSAARSGEREIAVELDLGTVGELEPADGIRADNVFERGRKLQAARCWNVQAAAGVVDQHRAHAKRGNGIEARENHRGQARHRRG